MKTLLEVKALSKFFPITSGLLRRHTGDIRAVDQVSFKLNVGQTLGVVGESGCGKSTLGRAIARLYEPTSGEILFKDQNFSQLGKDDLRMARRQMQMIFQDPYGSLNPRMSVREILEEPYRLHNLGKAQERQAWIAELMATVGLRQDMINRFPHEFSGGQRQRIGIARAIALKPELVICDEPVSALDVSIQSQILNLLVKLQRERQLAYIFISHDLGVVKYVSDHVAVMYLGRIVEIAPTDALFTNPEHPYTQALLSAAPQPDPNRKHLRKPLAGEVPSPANPPSGCHFHTRCEYVKQECRTTRPELKVYSSNNQHLTACHRVREIALEKGAPK